LLRVARKLPRAAFGKPIGRGAKEVTTGDSAAASSTV